MNDVQRQRFWIVLLSVSVEGGFIGLAWLLGWILNQPPLEHFRWSLEDFGLGIAICLPMLLAAGILLRWPIGPFAKIKQISEELIAPLFAPCTVLDLAIISLLAGLGEELVFRGVLQPVFGSRLGPLPGLLLTSLLFGFLHPLTGTYIVLATSLGLYLGWVADQWDNLLPVIVAHALYDFVLLVFLVRRQK